MDVIERAVALHQGESVPMLAPGQTHHRFFDPLPLTTPGVVVDRSPRCCVLATVERGRGGERA